jgi:hypothetical protein
MQKQTKAWSAGIKKDTQGATDAFDGVSKALTRFATQAISIVAIQKIGSAFVQVAKDISVVADEAEKVGASASKFYALDIAAKRNGASVSDIKIAYKELQKSVNEAVNGNKDTIASFNQLGLSFTYLASLKPDERFDLVAASLTRVTDENKKAEIGTKLLGKAYTEISSTINGLRSATQGRILFSDQDVKKIDQISKAFEGIGNAVNDEFRAALIKLAPALEAIAKLATLIVKNLDTAFSVLAAGFAALSIASVAFVRILNFELAAAIAKVAAQGGLLGLLASLADKIRVAFAYAAFAINVAWQALGGSVLAVLTTATAALSTLALSFTGTLLLISKGAKLVGLDTLAKQADDLYNSTYEFLAQLSGIAPSPDKFGFTQAQKDAADAEIATKKLAITANDAALSIDRENQALSERAKIIVKEGEDYAKAMMQFGKQITDSIKTPLENAQDEVDKLNEAFLFGYIGIDDYSKAIDKLKSSLDGVTRAQISLNAEMKMTNSQAVQFAGRGEAASMFGQGTITGTLGQAGGTAANLPRGIDQITSAYDELQKQLKSTGTSLLENGRTATEVYDTEVQAINAAVEAYKLQGREQDALRLQTIALLESSNKLRDANIEAFARSNPYIIQAFGYMSDFADQFSRAIVAGENFGEALSGVFKNILSDIAAMILRTTILQGIMAAIGIISPTTNAAAAFGQMTGLTGRANGGPVMAGGGYRVGERGPETFVPAANGYILPNDMAPSETIVVNQTINVQTGVAQTVRAEMASLLPRFKSEAMAGVLDAKQRGGSYARGLSV